MKITFAFDKAEKTTTIAPEAGEYDAIPLRDIHIQSAPIACSNDRKAVAAALLFHDSISGELELDDTVKCSRHVAHAISSFFDPLDVVVMPQTLTPDYTTDGNVSAVLTIGDSDTNGASALQTDDQMVLQFANGGVGAIYVRNKAVIGVNVPTDFSDPDQEVGDVIRLLGLCTILAEDHRIGRIRLPERFATEKAVHFLERARQLLNSVSLQLSWSL